MNTVVEDTSTPAKPAPDLRKVDLDAFKDTTFLRLKKHKIGNRAKVRDNAAYLRYLAQLEAEKQAAENAGAKVSTQAVAADIIKNGKKTDESKVAGKATKQLLVSEPLEELNGYIQKVSDSIIGRFGIAQQSRIMEGLYFVRDTVQGVDQRDLIEEIINTARAKVQSEFLPAFVADYPEAIERTRTLPVLQGGLGPIFDPADYPPEAEAFAANILAGSPVISYGISRLWIEMGVASTLSAKLRAQSMGEYRAQVQEAAEEAKQALRCGLGKFIDALVERLKPGEDGKKQIFRDSLTENISQFCAVFEQRNFANDTDLAELVKKCRSVLEGVSPEKLRKYESVRENTLSRFEELQAEKDKLIASAPSRVFDLTED